MPRLDKSRRQDFFHFQLSQEKTFQHLVCSAQRKIVLCSVPAKQGAYQKNLRHQRAGMAEAPRRHLLPPPCVTRRCCGDGRVSKPCRAALINCWCLGLTRAGAGGAAALTGCSGPAPQPGAGATGKGNVLQRFSHREKGGKVPEMGERGAGSGVPVPVTPRPKRGALGGRSPLLTPQHPELILQARKAAPARIKARPAAHGRGTPGASVSRTPGSRAGMTGTPRSCFG